MKKILALIVLVALFCGTTAALAGDRRAGSEEFSQEQLRDGFYLVMVRHSSDPLVCHKRGKFQGFVVNPPRWCYPEDGLSSMPRIKPNRLTEAIGEYKPETVLRALDALSIDDFWELYKLYQSSKDVKSYEGLVGAFPEKESIKHFRGHLERISKMSDE